MSEKTIKLYASTSGDRSVGIQPEEWELETYWYPSDLDKEAIEDMKKGFKEFAETYLCDSIVYVSTNKEVDDMNKQEEV
jgi:hypothetical protein